MWGHDEDDPETGVKGACVCVCVRVREQILPSFSLALQSATIQYISMCHCVRSYGVTKKDTECSTVTGHHKQQGMFVN